MTEPHVTIITGDEAVRMIDSYDAACRAAATDQGLDPIVEALTAADIDHDVAQTGGFCMVVHVPLPDNTVMHMVDGEEGGTAAGTVWLIGPHTCHRSEWDYDNCKACHDPDMGHGYVLGLSAIAGHLRRMIQERTP